MTDYSPQLCEAGDPEAMPEEWVAERKLDGVRIVADHGTLRTRSGRDVTAHFPEIDAPEHHVFDGEIITHNFSFSTALRRVQTEDRFKIDLLSRRYPASLVAFDALVINGDDVRERALTVRKELLEPSIPSEQGIVTATVHDDPAALWEQAQAEGWEGIILKDPDSPYRGKRTDEWQKLKTWNESTFPVVDHEHTDDGGFVAYVDIGDDEPQKVAVQPDDGRRAVESGAGEIEVQFLEWSDNGRLRKPSFRGVA